MLTKECFFEIYLKKHTYHQAWSSLPYYCKWKKFLNFSNCSFLVYRNATKALNAFGGREWGGYIRVVSRGKPWVSFSRSIQLVLLKEGLSLTWGLLDRQSN